MADITVTKRDGQQEPLDIDKLHKVVTYACNDITGVSVSEVEIKSQIQFYNGIKSTDIQETLIKSAADLISEETPNYQYVGGRLINYHLRKQVYGQFDPWPLRDIVEKNTASGFYDPSLLEDYDEEEYKLLNNHIRHDRDDTLTYAAMEQFRGKYLVQNRVTKEIYETPQICYMLVAMSLFSDYPKDTRLQWVKDYYDAISTFDISLPTPIMAGVRTPQRQFSSCVLIETDDSLDSINASASAIVKYVSQKAGIGIGAGSIRAIGSPIRKGDAYHTGVIPFYKHFQSAVKSCSQGGVRGGAATLHYPIWHYEVEDMLVLKNNKGTEDNRVRHIDYSVQFSKLFYERLINNGDITLFSPSDVPGLYESFFNDQEKFKELYEKAERATSIRKKTVKAQELFSSFMEERKNTGRIYLQNVDNVNDHSPFKPEVAPIRMSNLCQEIALPTKPMNDLSDENGLIALCTLSALNWGNVREPDDFRKPCELTVRGLDALLDYQKYPVLAAELHSKGYRPLGIGIINLAYFLAKNGSTYSEPDLELIDEYAEAWSYYLIKASVDLAKEKGPCGLNENTRYSEGILPIDTYKRTVDELVKHNERMPWQELRDDLIKYGIRNATLMAGMPAETSAQISNGTNGVESPRAFVSIKQSKDGVLKQVVPGYPRLKNKYELLWEQKSPEGYLKIMAVLQKYMDQSISVNTSYNPFFYEDEKIPMSVLLKDMLMAYRFGIKNLYYFNTNDGQGEMAVEEDKPELAEGTDMHDDEDCEACII